MKRILIISALIIALPFLIGMSCEPEPNPQRYSGIVELTYTGGGGDFWLGADVDIIIKTWDDFNDQREHLDIVVADNSSETIYVYWYSEHDNCDIRIVGRVGLSSLATFYDDKLFDGQVLQIYFSDSDF